jgi:hypothetical protein
MPLLFMYTYWADKVVCGFKVVETPPEACQPEKLSKPVFLVCCSPKLANTLHRLPARRQFQAPDIVVTVPTAKP